MATDSVHPLRISKATPNSSPAKMDSGIPRPLSEVSPTEHRRNSPSWQQSTGSPKKTAQNPDSSPFQSSPGEGVTSPRMFWQKRNSNSENILYGNGAPSPHRRSSIERLQRASRVKNSNILALEHKQEYDPTRIAQIERPLAKVQGHAYRSSDSFRFPETPRPPLGQHSRSDSQVSAMGSPSKSSQQGGSPNRPMTPSKEQASPTKSSLSSSRFKSSFDPETGAWSGDSSFNENDVPHGRSLHRHAKSVTFDAAPPQVNEYEMTTPDLSSIGTNSREGSYESLDEDEDDEDDDMLYDPSHVEIQDDSFDASLEDTDKTPVVGPDDWRGESPLVHRDSREELEESPMPDATPLASSRIGHRRSESVNSNGEHRPLPPLPGFACHVRSHSDSAPASPALSATAERMIGGHRSLPSPPSAAKLDLQNIGSTKMSLEERLKLMMLSDDNDGKTAAEQQRERRLRRASNRDRFSSPMSEASSGMIEHAEEDDTIGDISCLDDYELPPQISRESIMRRVNGQKAFDDSELNFSSPAPGSPPRKGTASPERQLPLDPDVPIPSTEEDEVHEDEFTEEEEEGSVIITRMVHDEDDDFYDESEFDPEEVKDLQMEGMDHESLYSDHELSVVKLEEPEVRSAIPPAIQPEIQPEIKLENKIESKPESQFEEQIEEQIEEEFSEEPAEQEKVQVQEQKEETKIESPVEDDLITPCASTQNHRSSFRDSLPNLSPGPQDDAFSRSFESFMLKEPEKQSQPEPEPIKIMSSPMSFHRSISPPLSKPEYDGSGWGAPEDDEEYDDPGSPGSVIHNPVGDDDIRIEIMQDQDRKESPAIPERYATVKASGSKLKTRISNTPNDIASMREARRHVSREIPGIPPIPSRHRDRLSKDLSNDLLSTGDDFLDRHPSFKNRSLTLDLDLGLSLDQDFERVIETQKRGYLMRQNTKVITASDKDTDDPWAKTRSAGNSPVKTTRPQSWTVEPWNSKTRPRSLRKRAGTTGAGPVPPLPGQESNASTAAPTIEEDVAAEMATPESGERGRLFVKVMGVKDLDLPLPKNERTWFSLTLDNGVHCVTTAWLELARNAPIGQEFELVVPNDLEFQLTLNVKLEKPPPVRLPPPSVRQNKPKASTFSRVFASPKKRKELELRYREEEELLAQQQRDAHARQRNIAPTAYDLLSPVVAEDGSFGRAYVCLKEHENRCFGRPYMAEVACFNEWATEDAGFASSIKSKRGTSAVVRKAPYKIGKLEVQLLFVPRPKNSVDEDMPKSMNSCIRELKAAEERLSRCWEGHLSQQGGDCPYWRRRYFKLVGAKLTAYHEATRQPRATINLSNAKRLIDDRRALIEKETLGKGGKRRRSAFAEDEEGYMFVEEGFRIRFNNGEVIDFYADTAEDKESWMKIFSEVIGRDPGIEEETNGVRSRAKWCELVLKREEQLRRRASGRRIHSRTKSMYV